MSVQKINDLIQLSRDLSQFMTKEGFFENRDELLERVKLTEDKLKNRRYTISVVAAMKAGKSTTFNALIGRDLLPNERKACTAAITEIKHSMTPTDYIIKQYTDGKFVKLVKTNDLSLEEVFHEDVRQSRSEGNVESIEKYHLETPLKILEGTDYEELVQNFILIDTPGPNEAGIGDFDVTILQRLALEQLKNSDALIMLLDYESYKSETNAKILKDIFENREDLAREQHKVYFLVNKIDTMTHKDGTVEQVLNDVKSLIKQYAPVLKNPQVYGFSARQAQLSRCVIAGTATEDMKKQMVQDYGAKYSKTVMIEDQEFQVLPKAENFAIELLEESRIMHVEKEIVDNVFNQASEELIVGALNKLENTINKSLSDAHSQIEALNFGIKELLNSVNASKKELEGLKNNTNSLKQLPLQHFATMKQKIDAILQVAKENIIDILYAELPEEDTMTSYDPDALAERIKLMEKNVSVSIQSYLTTQVDKVQRLCMEYQSTLNQEINRKFNELVEEATKSASDMIKFTPKTFDIEEVIESRNRTLDDYIQHGYENAGTEVVKTFDGIGAAVGAGGGAAAGAAAGAALGTVVPIVGNVIGGVVGAVVGGLGGLLFGSKKEKVQQKQKEVFSVDLTQIKQELTDKTTEALNETIKQVNEKVEEISKSYQSFINQEIDAFIQMIDADLTHVLEDFNKNKENQDTQIKYLLEVKLGLADFLDRTLTVSKR